MVVWWCFCGGVVVFLWWRGGVFVLVFLLCFCGGVFVVVFLWWCLVVVFLWWCSCRCVCVFLGDRHHVFIERVARRQMKFAFRYSFGRSTPRFYREGCPTANEIRVSLQFWAIDTTFLPRGLTASK